MEQGVPQYGAVVAGGQHAETAFAHFPDIASGLPAAGLRNRVEEGPGVLRQYFQLIMLIPEGKILTPAVTGCFAVISRPMGHCLGWPRNSLPIKDAMSGRLAIE